MFIVLRLYASRCLTPNNKHQTTDDITICLNIDGFNISGPREDYFVMPRQGIDFLDEIQSVAAGLGWVYDSPDRVDGMNTSFDTAAFLRKGIPAFTLWTGSRLKGSASRSVTPPVVSARRPVRRF